MEISVHRKKQKTNRELEDYYYYKPPKGSRTELTLLLTFYFYTMSWNFWLGLSHYHNHNDSSLCREERQRFAIEQSNWVFRTVGTEVR